MSTAAISLSSSLPAVRVLGYCQDGSYAKFVAAVDAAYVEAYENGDNVATYYMYGPLDGRNVL